MLKISLTFLTLVTGSAFWWVSGHSWVAFQLKGLESKSAEIASIYSSYAFTVAGFLATISTFLYALGGRPYFDLYKRRGNFSDLMWLHVLCIMILAMLFIVSIFMHSHAELVRLGTVLAAVSFMQLGLLTLISFSLSKRSQE